MARLNEPVRRLLAECGATIRESRRARRWSQRRLGHDVGLSHAEVGRIERAEVPDLSFRVALRLLEATGGRLDARFIGANAEAPAIRDRAHTRCVGYVARRFERAGWLVATEMEVLAGGGRWRSFIDIATFHEAERLLLVVEVKTEIHDIGGIDRQLGLAERGAWEAARRRGWRPRAVVPVLLLLSTRENDRRLADHRTYFDSRLPIRARQLAAVVDGRASEPPDGKGAVAMFDPQARRRQWLQPTWLDGRRAEARYLNRAGYLAGQVLPRTDGLPGQARVTGRV